MKLKIEIKNRWTGKVIFEFETENNTVRKTVEEAIKSGADLSWADLSEADLSGADLSEADLSEADLSWANLSEADLSWANLSVIKADFFYVLLHAKHEISYLKQALIDGKIDGSTYSGECACLSGTVEKGAIKNNGPQEQFRKDLIMSCRDGNRPAERFFLAIRPEDTPENNQAAKIVMQWIEEFERLIL